MDGSFAVGIVMLFLAGFGYGVLAMMAYVGSLGWENPEDFGPEWLRVSRSKYD